MRVLLIFDPNRKDLFSYFKNDTSNDYFLLFNDKKKEQLDPALNFIQKEFGWHEYDTPFEVLKKITPDRIVFHEVFDLKQIALNIAARHKRVPTFLVDHGIWSDFEELLQEDKKLQKTARREKLKKLRRVGKVIRGYFFYYSTLRGISFGSICNFFLFPIYAFFQSLVKAVNRLPFKERIPHLFILFTRYNFQPLKSYYHFTEKDVRYSGFPYFDSFYSPTSISEEEYIVFIDHPYLEDGILGWDAAFHRQLANGLLGLAEETGLKVQVKLHPRSDINLWKAYKFPPEKIDFVRMVVDNDFYTKSKIIIGYASTLMIGFISAKKNVVLVGWHPEPSIFGPDFAAYDVCHKSMKIEDVYEHYPYWVSKNLSIVNKSAYNAFMEEFNFPFDGKATGRIIDTVTTHEIF